MQEGEQRVATCRKYRLDSYTEFLLLLSEEGWDWGETWGGRGLSWVAEGNWALGGGAECQRGLSD